MQHVTVCALLASAQQGPALLCHALQVVCSAPKEWSYPPGTRLTPRAALKTVILPKMCKLKKGFLWTANK